MRKKITNFVESHIFIIVLLALFIFSFFSWGNFESYIFGHDGSIWINPILDIKKFYYSLWTEQFGGTSLSHQGLFPLSALSYLIDKLHIFPIFRKIIFSLLFILPVYSFREFIKKVINKNTDNYSLTIGALFYGLNFFTVQRWHEVQWSYILSFSLLPLFLKYFYQYVTKNDRKSLVVGVLIVVINSINLSDPPIIIGYWGVSIILFLLLYIKINKMNFLNILYKLFILLFCSLLCTAFVMLPLLVVVANIGNQEFTSNLSLNYPNLVNQRDGILGLIRQMGYFYLYLKKPQTSEYFYEFIKIYDTPIFILSIFVISIISLSYILKKNTNRIKIFSLASIVVGLTLANGIQYPTGDLFKWLYYNVPFFWIFRSPDNKFYPLYLLGLGILLTLSLSKMKINNIYTWFIKITVLICIFVYSIPFFRGYVPTKNHIIDIPKEYLDAASYINNDKFYSSVMFVNKNIFAYYDLNKITKYSGSNLLIWLLDKGEMWNPDSSHSSFNIADRLNKAYFDAYDKIDIDLLSSMNIRYLILNKDLDYQYHTRSGNGAFRELGMEEYIKLLSKLEIVFSNENINIYRIPNTKPILFLDDYTYGDNRVAEYRKISPTKYIVILHNINSQTKLVLNQTYNKGWTIYLTSLTNKYVNLATNTNETNVDVYDFQASDKVIQNYRLSGVISNYGSEYISKNTFGSIQNENIPNLSIFNSLSKKQVTKENEHQIYDGYANNWIIDPSIICENNNKCVKKTDNSYDIALIVEFKPQQLFYIGITVSGITIIFITVYLLILKFRERRIK